MDLPRQLKRVTPHHAPLLLELDLTQSLLEERPHDPVGILQARRKTLLRTMLDGLHAAAADSRVRGVIARVGGPIQLAQAQELRAAVLDFRRSGKPTVAWAETFGEFGPGSAGYVLATGFEEIWLQPSGDVGLTGVSVEAVFLREALDRAGIEPQVARRYEYKNAADMFLQRGFTDAHREASARLAASAYEQIESAVAQGRRLSAQAVRALVDRAPLGAEEARAGGLVDRIGYRDEAYAAARARAGADSELLYINHYHRGVVQKAARRIVRRHPPTVALIHGIGAIRQGHSGRGLAGPSMGSDTVAGTFRAAVRDDAVRAIVFRINSPGGSYIASDTIWREVGLARQAGKPVVVSMADLAASGGYFVAAPADVIVAQPGTLTGSIGVFGGKPLVTGLLDRLGVGHDAVAEGAHARMFSTRAPFTEDEWRRIEEWLDRAYEDFVGKVAEGRGLSRDQVHEVARGRVWTGADARERGLVDELGGLDRAVELARSRAGLSADAPVRQYPHLGQLRRLRTPRSSEDPAATAAAAYAPGWGPLAELAARVGLPAGGPLLMPPLRLR